MPPPPAKEGIPREAQAMGRLGTLLSPETLMHGGAGGVFLSVDPINELVGIYFPAALQDIGGLAITSAELFANAVIAAIDD